MLWGLPAPTPRPARRLAGPRRSREAPLPIGVLAMFQKTVVALARSIGSNESNELWPPVSRSKLREQDICTTSLHARHAARLVVCGGLVLVLARMM